MTGVLPVDRLRIEEVGRLQDRSTGSLKSPFIGASSLAVELIAQLLMDKLFQVYSDPAKGLGKLCFIRHG